LLFPATATPIRHVTPATVADHNAMRPALYLTALLAASACHSSPGVTGDDDPGPDAGADAATGCPAGHAGAACVIALYDEAIAGCAPDVVTDLVTELDARAGLGPLWAGGRALFRTSAPRGVAGTFDDWSTTAITTTAVCGSSVIATVGPVASGFHTYKLVDGSTWSLDATNPAFAYDDFEGNADGVNSVLNTPDSGRGHLVALDSVCSAALGNCRDVTAYLPPAYNAPQTATTTYPVLFMHDGQNVWDDHDCCFGHTGWEVNVAFDAELAAGRVAPAIVIAAAHSTNRNDEYGLSQQAMATFMEFQVTELQPKMLAKIRGNGSVFVGGSSLGGLVSMQLALRYPQTYAGAASLSGAFWPGMEDGVALRDQLPAMGKQALAIYLDHGGAVGPNSDGAADSVEIRDMLVGLGWQRADSPACTAGPDALCYFHEPGATHDELAWKDRTWRFLRFLFPR
jgi:predicted alpha/beta superfamily hydrolase